MRKILSIFAAMFIALAANAAVINIDNTTADALRLALNGANDGDEIVMAAGTYVESNENYIAFAGKHVTVKAAEGAEVLIQPKVPVQVTEGGCAHFVNVKFDASHLTELADWYEHLIYPADANANNSIILDGCELYGFNLNKSMLYCSGSNVLGAITINNCQIHNCMKSVLFVENTSAAINAQVTNSTFADIATNTESYWAGIIDIRNANANLLVDHCTFYNVIPMNTDYSCVSKITLANGAASNCIFMLPTAQDGIRAMRGVTATNCITFNYLKDNGTGIHSSVTQNNCVQVDPAFVDPDNGNFTLAANSPALTMNDGQPIGDPRWVPAPAPVLETGFYLVGSFNSWTPAAEYHLVGNPDNNAEFMINVTLAENDELKVVNVLNNEITAWFPGGNNYVVDAAHAGEKTVYFRPDYQGGDDWYEHCIYIAPNEVPVDEWAKIFFTEAVAADDLAAEATFSLLGSEFALTLHDSGNKMVIDGNDCRFGTAEDYTMYNFRLKSGGASGSDKNYFTLNIPEAGTLRIAPRTGSNSATDRALIVIQGGDTLYNQIVQESQAIEIQEGENTVKVYPYVDVTVAAGEVVVRYTAGMNFYAFAFKAAGGETPVVLDAPDAAPAAPTYPANQVHAMYSATYNADCAFGEWGSGTQYTQEEFGKKYVTTQLGYFGMEFPAGVDCSNMEALHLDVWAANDFSLRVVPIHGGTEVGKTVNIEGQKWNAIDIPLTEFVGVENWSNVIQIKIDEARGVTFWLNNVYFYTTQEQFTYTVAGSSAAAFGTTWDPANAENDMVRQGDGTYKWEKTNIELAEGEIAFKVCENHAWTHAWPAQDYKLAIPEGGLYTVTITFDPAAEADKVAANATKTGEAVVLPTVILHGNFTGSWADTDPFVAAADRLTAALTLTLAEGTYEFGFKFDGAWKANGANITRDANTANLATGEGNMHITADVAGEYVFVYTFATQELVVTYPVNALTIPEDAPVPTAAEEDVMAIFCNHYPNNNANFGISGWAGGYQILDLNGINVGYWTGMTWECIIDPAHTDDAHDFSAYKNLHVDLWAPLPAKIKFTAEAVNGGNYKDGQVVEMQQGWNSVDFVVADWAGNYDFKNLKCFVFEQYQTLAGESFEGNPFAFANIYFYGKEEQGVENVNDVVKAVKMIENGQVIIIKNGVKYNVMGARVR